MGSRRTSTCRPACPVPSTGTSTRLQGRISPGLRRSRAAVAAGRCSGPATFPSTSPRRRSSAATSPRSGVAVKSDFPVGGAGAAASKRGAAFDLTPLTSTPDLADPGNFLRSLFDGSLIRDREHQPVLLQRPGHQRAARPCRSAQRPCPRARVRPDRGRPRSRPGPDRGPLAAIPGGVRLGAPRLPDRAAGLRGPGSRCTLPAKERLTSTTLCGLPSRP
jgi:hypothetical protein